MALPFGGKVTDKSANVVTGLTIWSLGYLLHQEWIASKI